MNILVLPTWFHNKLDKNAGVFTLEQSQELNKKHNVVIFFPFDLSLSGWFKKDIEFDLVTYRSRGIRKKIPILTNWINQFIMLIHFEKILKEFRPDIIHAHVANGAGYYAYLISKRYNIPYIVTEHCPYDMMISSKRSELRAQKVYNYSRENIAVSYALARQYKKICNFRIIYNGIKTDIIPVYYSFSNKNINIAFVASFYDLNVKGVKYLFEALNIVKDKYPNIKLHIIGDGIYKNYYEEQARKLEINEFIHFYGYLEKPNVVGIINSCDFLVSSSLVETFGVAIVEALMMGKPVVVTKCGGPEEFVDEINGIQVKVEDSIELSKGIIHMIENHMNYDSLIISNRSIERFSMKKLCEEYTKLYNNCLKDDAL